MEALLTKERILAIVEQRKMSKSEFASALGIQRQNLDSLLNSQKKDINVVMKMADVLRIPLEEFIGIQPPQSNIHGYVKVNDVISEIKCKNDLEEILKSL